MPLSTVLGAQSVVKPGVCTSSTRPDSPFDGQMIYETDTNLVKAYNGSAWETVNPISAVASAEVATTQQTTSTSYTDLATVGPSLTVTTGTTAIVLITAQASVNSLGPLASMSVAVSGATTIAASDSFRCVSGVEYEASVASTSKYTTLTAGSNTFTAKYKTSSGQAQFQRRTITVWAL